MFAAVTGAGRQVRASRQLTALASSRAVVVLPVPRPGKQEGMRDTSRSDSVPQRLDNMLLADNLLPTLGGRHLR